MCKLAEAPLAAKLLPPDDWRRYEDDAPAAEDLPEAGPAAVEKDTEDAEEEMPHEFAESVKLHRERLIASYRNYRR
jgi:hypothetical protein